MNMDKIRTEALHRYEKMCTAREALIQARTNINSANGELRSAWQDWAPPYQQNGDRAHALSVLTGGVIDDIEEQIANALSQLAALIARDVIAPVAQKYGHPVVALTSNAYMPPIRDIFECEVIWKNSRNDEWQLFIENLERKLDENSIMMSSPDHDNMLYVTDTKQWALSADVSDDPNGHLDNDAWQRIATYEQAHERKS
jgi:hypothetical protein